MENEELTLADKEGTMTIDRQTLAELATRLKNTSDTVHKTTHHLAAVPSTGNPSTDAAWAGTMEGMVSINNEIAVMQRILNVLWLRSVPRPPRAN